MATLQQFLESVEGRDVSAQNFLKDALCFEELRAHLDPDTVRRLYTANAEDRKKIIGEVVGAVRRGSPPKGAEGLPQFQPGEDRLSQGPSETVDPRSVADAVSLIEPTVLKQRDENVKKIQKRISEIVPEYARALRQEARDDLMRKLNESTQTDDLEKARNAAINTMRESHDPNTDTHELTTIAEEIFKNPDLQRDAEQGRQLTNKIINNVVDYASEPNYTKSFLGKINAATEITDDTIAGAAQFARVAAVVGAPETSLGKPDFRSVGVKTDVTAELQKAAGNLRLLQGWDAAGGFDGITKKLGADIFSSEAAQELLRSGNQLATQLRGEQALQGAGRLVNKIFTTPPDQQVITYFQVLAKNGSVNVDANQFFLGALYGDHSNMFLEWILRGLGKKGATAGATAAVEKGVVSAGLAGMRKAATSAISKFLLKLGLTEATATALGGPIGAIVGAALWLGSEGLKKIGGFLMAGAGMLAGAVSGFATGSLGLPPAPKTWADKHAVLLIVIGSIGLPVIVLMLTAGFVVPGSFSTNIISLTGGAMGSQNAVGGGTVAGPIGSVTSSCADTKGVYLFQGNPSWGETSYGGACTISNCGCGPTSVTMILHAFGSDARIQDVWARVAAASNTGSPSMGCSTAIDPNLTVMQNAGLAVTELGGDWASAGKEADLMLKSCHLIFAWGIAHHNGRNIWHFIVIDGINWDTTGNNVVSFHALDPEWGVGTQDGSTFSILDLWAVGK